MVDGPLYTTNPETGAVHLHSPTLLPKAGGFLWNNRMMLQMNCRGYATAQFMQPEPAKYAHGPAQEAKTFMQPEHPYFSHHPGRFFYLRDNDTKKIFSAPFAPVNAPLDKFDFIIGQSSLIWNIEKDGIQIELKLSLTTDDVIELWQVTVSNISGDYKTVSLFPYFPIGYMSWMNQSADFDPTLNGIIADSITPYQKIDDYYKNTALQDKTFFLADRSPNAWLANQEAFEGDSGLGNPTALKQDQLANTPAHYETPAAVMQFDLELATGQSSKHRFLFGPAKDKTAISRFKVQYFGAAHNFDQASAHYANHISSGKGCLSVQTPDKTFDHFVNNWLPRQAFYLGDVNRLSTDPQTRNYLQDHIGMTYIKPELTRASFIKALSQQAASGEMPEGILLSNQAELKYINQVPHADHCIWLPISLQAYLSETGDFTLLDEILPFKNSTESASILEHINRAMNWLIKNRDDRGLSYIKQGDWCDPMNMVGHKGRGVSGWLSLATAYALKEWADICTQANKLALVSKYLLDAEAFNNAVNTHLWDGQWYARGITDDGVKFGVSTDLEGRIFLNPQSWALLSGAAGPEQTDAMLGQIDSQLATPYGVTILAPAYTKMREDIGRVTQKFPGSAENGAVYNHASIFYAYSLYKTDNADRAYDVLRKMLPDETDAIKRGQLPTFIPNYYRGAYHQFPRTAGISSQLFNTGTVAWYYRCVIEELFGLKGSHGTLLIEPKLPAEWDKATARRTFAGATFNVTYLRRQDCTKLAVSVNGQPLNKPQIKNIKPGVSYDVSVILPYENQARRIPS